ncbi:MAG: hypothetical protein ACJAR1_001556 [Rubritalea sp.]|jgi:hypothetical protein|tara:strand:- start:8506 stop:8724 length:219 start_codon:yes stop_codon:yes gene_type:complete
MNMATMILGSKFIVMIQDWIKALKELLSSLRIVGLGMDGAIVMGLGGQTYVRRHPDFIFMIKDGCSMLSDLL